MNPSKTDQRKKRHSRMRRNLVGTAERPRLQIARTLHHIYAIVVDDTKGHTLASASTRQKGMLGGDDSATNIAAAEAVGKAIAEKAKAAGINAVVFDRNGLQYHGRVKALADAARGAGLEF